MAKAKLPKTTPIDTKQVDIRQLMASLKDLVDKEILDPDGLFKLTQDLNNNLSELNNKEDILNLIETARFLPNFDHMSLSKIVERNFLQFELDEINKIFGNLKSYIHINKPILAKIIQPLAEVARDKFASASSFDTKIENFLLLAQLKYRDQQYYDKWQEEFKSYDKEIQGADAVKIIQSIVSLNFRDDAIIEKLYNIDTTNFLEQNILKLFYLTQYYVLNQDIAADFKNTLYNYIIAETRKINVDDVNGKKSQIQFLQIYTAFKQELQHEVSQENIQWLIGAVQSRNIPKTTYIQSMVQKFLETNLSYLKVKIESEKYVLSFSPSDIVIIDKDGAILCIVEVDGPDHNYINNLGDALAGNLAEVDTRTKFRDFLLGRTSDPKKLIAITVYELLHNGYKHLIDKILTIFPDNLVTDAPKVILPEGKMAAQMPLPTNTKREAALPAKKSKKTGNIKDKPNTKGHQKPYDDDNFDSILQELAKPKDATLSPQSILALITQLIQAKQTKFHTDILDAIESDHYDCVKLKDNQLHNLVEKICYIINKETNLEYIERLGAAIIKIIYTASNKEVKRGLIGQALFSYVQNVQSDLLATLIATFQPNLDILDDKDYALLQYAVDNFMHKPGAKEDVLNILKILLDNGANPDIISKMPQAQRINTVMNVVTIISQAVRFEDENLFKLLLQYKPSFNIGFVSNDKGAEEGGTILHLASLRENIAIFKDLLEKNHITKEIDINKAGEQYESAFLNYFVALLYHQDINPNIKKVKLFLKYGADPNIVSKKSGDNVFHLIALLSHVIQKPNFAIEALKLFIKEQKNLRFDIQNKRGLTPLMIAAISNNVEFLKVLISQPNINLNAYDKDGNTAISHAAIHTNKDSFKLLATIPGIRLDIPNNSGLTTLCIVGFASEKEIQDLVFNTLGHEEKNPLRKEFWKKSSQIFFDKKAQTQKLIDNGHPFSSLEELVLLAEKLSQTPQPELCSMIEELQQEKEKLYPKFQYYAPEETTLKDTDRGGSIQTLATDDNDNNKTPLAGLIKDNDHDKSTYNVISNAASETQQILRFYPSLQYFVHKIMGFTSPDIYLSTEGKALIDLGLGMIKIYGKHDLVVGQVFASLSYYSGLKIAELLYQRPVEEKVTDFNSFIRICGPEVLISAVAASASLLPMQAMYGAVSGASGCLNKHEISAVETALGSFARVAMDVTIGTVAAYFAPEEFFNKAMVFISSAVSTDISMHLGWNLALTLQGQVDKIDDYTHVGL